MGEYQFVVRLQSQTTLWIALAWNPKKTVRDTTQDLNPVQMHLLPSLLTQSSLDCAQACLGVEGGALLGNTDSLMETSALELEQLCVESSCRVLAVPGSAPQKPGIWGLVIQP